MYIHYIDANKDAYTDTCTDKIDFGAQIALEIAERNTFMHFTVTALQ